MGYKRSNKELVETLINVVFNKHDLSILDEIMRDDYIQHNEEAAQGKAGFVEFFTQTFKAIPDFKYNNINTVADGDIVMTYNRNTGTHTGGDWIGQPARGNKLDFNVVDIFRIEGGQIAEHWDVADTYLLFKQVGRI